MMKKEPLVFEPYLKSVIWGGNKITAYKKLPATTEKIGESWEISAVPGHESIVKEGVYKGKKLTELVDEFGVELLGTKVEERFGNFFPLLIKFIDAADNLSVQVHPDDKLAKERHDSLGKTEMWYIIQTDEGASLYAGFNKPLTKAEYEQRVKENTLEDVLQKHVMHPGETIFIPAGRVHAIGAGNLLAEIQESSDVTYRIYDYNRRDAQGNPRELHTTEALDSINFDNNTNVSIVDVSPHGDATIVKCDHFVTDRVLVDDVKNITVTSDSFKVLICITGSVKIKYQDGVIELKEGNSVLLPAGLGEITLRGSATLLVTEVQ